MDHKQSRQVWCEAALNAADSTDDRSAEILKIILPRLVQNSEIGKTLAEDIVIKIVSGVCEEAEEFELKGESLLKIENVAIDKIQTLEGLIGKVDVVGVKVMTGKLECIALQ